MSPSTGTVSFAVPLPCSRGRNGFGPQLALSYNSGHGNGAFGFGWALDVPAVTRKTDKGLPRYMDDEESDVFILSGADDLVPVLDSNGSRVRARRTVNGAFYDVAYYRPRTEGLFARVERWVALATGLTHWRTISRDNVTSLYGTDEGSRVADPTNASRVFSYRLSRMFDDKGNVAVYDYVAEDSTGVVTTQTNESNRTTTSRTAQRYLKRVRYGNAYPYQPTWSSEDVELPADAEWRFELVLDYGDHARDSPSRNPSQPWATRPDAFSTYRPGFEVRTYRRCQRVLMFHRFPDEVGVGDDCLARSLDLVYSDQVSPADPKNPIYTLLVSVTQAGYRRTGNGYLRKALPPLELEYSQAQIQPIVTTLDADSLTNLPEGLDGVRHQWVDLDGEGLPGILTEVGDGWGYKRNLGAHEAHFGPLEIVDALTSRRELHGTQRLLDLTGDGRLDVVSFDEALPGFFERTADESWEPFRSFHSLPRVNWSEPNLKLVDLTGDGLADVLFTDDGLFTMYPSLGADGFGLPEQTSTPWDEERGPHTLLEDGTHTVFLADMSGDGLSDLVRVRNGEVSYWPNLGYGRFGPKVTMDAAPRFADDERFDPRRVRLADIDGSGTADLVYVGDDGVWVCFNQSGNVWATPQRIAVFPGADQLSSVQVIDLLGNGTACLVWSSPLPGAGTAPLRYVDLMGGKKPHLLERVRNNLGAETHVSYAPSTRFYLTDRRHGKPWVTRLPFPVQVAERVETYDFIGCSRFVTRYAYHHGYFDGAEREFRGFGMVEQWDTEEHRDDTAFPNLTAANWDVGLWAAPVLTRTWFHTGAFIEAPALANRYASEYYALDVAASRLSDSVLDPGDLGASGFTAAEMREAYRALKGLALRTEVYAEDHTASARHPYVVTERSYTVRLEQPMNTNRHAVVFAHPRESRSSQYERRADDPRVAHDFTLEVDAFGNVLRTVSVSYPRRAGVTPEPTLPALFQGMLAYDQSRLRVIATEHRFTDDLTDPTSWPDTHRTPLPAETLVAELLCPTTGAYQFDAVDALWTLAWDGLHDAPTEQVPTSDVDGSGPLTSTVSRRLLEKSRVLYRSDDLTGLLPLGELQALALPGEVYHLALTTSMLERVLGTRLPATTSSTVMAEGGYLQPWGGSDWWMPSGRIYLSPGDTDDATRERAEARAHFYLPRRAVGPFGDVARVAYDAYDLLVVSHVDALGNTTALTNDYRVLQPLLITDPNGNRTQVAFDASGFVAGSAAMGKTTELLGDSLEGFEPDVDDATLATLLDDPTSNPAALLGNATTRFVYDVAGYFRTRANPQPDPPLVYVLARETHVSDLSPAVPVSRYQHHLTYSDGFEREIQRKSFAGSGRWIGSGWTIFDNKGKPVRRYEPFFTSTHHFEVARTAGVSSVLFYDPPGRVVATLHPDSTWEKTIIGPWRKETWDANDTVAISDARTDADVGDWFTRLLENGAAAFTSWYAARIGGAWGAGAAEGAAAQDAARKTAPHANTPTVTHLDTLGRACLTVQDNGAEGRYPSRAALDSNGHPLVVVDALGRRAFEYCVREAGPSGVIYLRGHDLAGNILYSNGMDAGERRTLADVAGNAIRSWDALGRNFRTKYDLLRRPTHRYVAIGTGPEILFERLVYGEGASDRNLCARLMRHYDGGGLASNDRYDFKGNLVESSRQLGTTYSQSVDWTALESLTDLAALDAAAAPLLGVERFTTMSWFDALERLVQMTTSHSAAMRPNVLRRGYNESGQLVIVDAWLQQTGAPTALLDPSTADLHAVTDIQYDARGERTSLSFGNGTITTYEHDPQTFRLSRLTTTRPATFAADERVVQDLAYTYDPVGNITRIRDGADIHDVIYFRNQRVEPSSDYTYDATYRLTVATGREHLGQAAGAVAPPQQITSDDGFRTGLVHPNDGTAMGTYTESYAYDAVGNILAMTHRVPTSGAVIGSWTRRYAYGEPSSITATETCNRLSSTSAPGDPDVGPYSATYEHDLHGNMTRMPHLPSMTWDESDRLRSTTTQVVSAVGATPETTFYVYDAAGARLYKVTERQSAAGVVATRMKERIYLGSIEIYRELDADGVTVTLQRETLHVMDDARRVCLVEFRTAGTDSLPAQLVRFQHGNQLESACLELDSTAAVVSYEEYFPFGGTSYQALGDASQAKRYRFASKERDEENSLYYYGARYYAPWLGRWTAVDPAISESTTSIEHARAPYCCFRDNPVCYVDPNGRADVRIILIRLFYALNNLFTTLRPPPTPPPPGTHQPSTPEPSDPDDPNDPINGPDGPETPPRPTPRPPPPPPRPPRGPSTGPRWDRPGRGRPSGGPNPRPGGAPPRHRPPNRHHHHRIVSTPHAEQPTGRPSTAPAPTPAPPVANPPTVSPPTGFPIAPPLPQLPPFPATPQVPPVESYPGQNQPGGEFPRGGVPGLDAAEDWHPEPGQGLSRPRAPESPVPVLIFFGVALGVAAAAALPEIFAGGATVTGPTPVSAPFFQFARTVFAH